MHACACICHHNMLDLLSSSVIVIVAVLAVALGPSPDGGSTGMLSEPKNCSSLSSIMSEMMDMGTVILASSGFRVKGILFPM